eukprot:TRINITY_DN10539_c0_g1_i1.p2 TRINITY_DN10539_c0_g1~~TRINITY_DN10539_c0_g1_i1.p2  ORF type:complete len:100 (+),score=10.51 TRINITY_DN10539_c0_g1_i1:112-411(+)
MNEEEIMKRRLRQRAAILKKEVVSKAEENKRQSKDESGRGKESSHLKWALFRQSWLDVTSLCALVQTPRKSHSLQGPRLRPRSQRLQKPLQDQTHHGLL